MNDRAGKTLLLALGNDILGDDGVGFAAARAIAAHSREDVEVVLSGEAGLALLELLEGYDRALLLDAIVTGRVSPGTLHEFAPADFRRVLAPSPHYAGLPEIFDLAGRLGVAVPRALRVLAMEVEDPYTVREDLSPSVAAALPAFVARCEALLAELAAATLSSDRGAPDAPVAVVPPAPPAAPGAPAALPPAR